MKKNPKVVVIGCGFGGIELANSLKNKPFEVLLLDKNNYHTFQPLLYQVATGGLEPDSIAHPIRKIIRGYNNVSFRMATVTAIDSTSKTVKTSLGDISFDYLVIATGSTNNFFNFEPIKKSLLPLKSVVDALNIRSYLMQNLEKAISTFNPSEKEELMNIGIVGGGPAGIELAGALAEMRKYVFPKDFPEIDFSKMSINIFEASPKLLSNMSVKASEKSLKYLNDLGVNVLLNSKVKEIQDDKICLEDGTVFKTDSVIWTAGVKCESIDGINTESITSGNRLEVNEFNQLKGHESIFVVGDIACHSTENTPKGLPLLAPVAIQQAHHLVKNLDNIAAGKPMVPFKYKNKGVMATIGRNKAVVDLPNKSFQGKLAWFVWMFIHLMSLVGFRNKLVTFVDWSINYLNYDRPLGLIIRPFKKGN